MSARDQTVTEILHSIAGLCSERPTAHDIPIRLDSPDSSAKLSRAIYQELGVVMTPAEVESSVYGRALQL